MVGITKWKPLELLLHRKRVNQKQCHIPWGVAEISVTIKYPKVTEVVILTISPFNLPIWCVQKTAGSCRMAVGYCKLSQGVTPTAIAVSDVVPLLEQINSAFPCTWYVEISLQMLISLYLLVKITRSSSYDPAESMVFEVTMTEMLVGIFVRPLQVNPSGHH